VTNLSATAAAAARDADAITVSASPGVAQLLSHLRTSLLVSTYERGAVAVIRGIGPNLAITMLRVDRAMGIAAEGNRLAIGTRHRIMQMTNNPSLAPSLPGNVPGAALPDACYTPLHTHVTGEIDLHEMAFGGEDLWFVNTRFSCLCTLDLRSSFVPRWRPPFVTRYAPEDRCHLNGLALGEDGRPRYVTAFAVSDTAEGWRPERTTGGLVMDVDSGEIVARGLSMPHSPRLHNGALWVLDSGRGGLSRVDVASGRVDTVATFDGFTRGLDFVGNFAFVGLSQVRESKSFGGTPMAERVSEDRRFCGVQVVDATNGRVLGHLQFETGVGEVFAVQALAGIGFPAFVEDSDPLVGATFVLPPEALSEIA